jgi:hypothetical protein
VQLLVASTAMGVQNPLQPNVSRQAHGNVTEIHD